MKWTGMARKSTCPSIVSSPVFALATCPVVVHAIDCGSLVWPVPIWLCRIVFLLLYLPHSYLLWSEAFSFIRQWCLKYRNPFYPHLSDLQYVPVYLCTKIFEKWIIIVKWEICQIICLTIQRPSWLTPSGYRWGTWDAERVRDLPSDTRQLGAMLELLFSSWPAVSVSISLTDTY